MPESSDIHYENPFVTPIEMREPSRRLRGRLAAPVTVWTAGPPEEPVGLTMSSVILAEGLPSILFGLMNETSDLWDAIHETRAFVVHVLEERDRALADVFAGLRPSPGGMFAGRSVDQSAWGPVLPDIGNRAYCRYKQSSEAGHQFLIRGEIERVELTDLERPLGYFRGRYRSLHPQQPGQR